MSSYHFTKGERVELHPACDMWMRGARYGTVVAMLPHSGMAGADGIKADMVRVKLDKWPRPLLFASCNVNPI